MKYPFYSFILPLLLLTACNNNHNKLIIGKWTCVNVQSDFSALESLDDEALSDQEKLIIAAFIPLVNSFKGSSIHFTEDGTFYSFKTNNDKADNMGKFRLGEDGKILICQYSNQEFTDTLEIVILTQDSLITATRGDEVPIRLSYARKK